MPLFTKHELRRIATILAAFDEDTRDYLIGFRTLDGSHFVECLEGPKIVEGNVSKQFRSVMAVWPTKTTWLVADVPFTNRLKPVIRYAGIQLLVAHDGPHPVFRGRLAPLVIRGVDRIRPFDMTRTQTAEQLCSVLLEAAKTWETRSFFINIWTMCTLSAPLLTGRLTKIVAFGLGPLTRNGLNSHPIARHAILLALWNSLKTRHKELECYSEDRRYDPEHKLALTNAGVRVLDDPGGFLEADENTRLISIDPNIPVKQVIADIGRPLIIIWSKSRLLAGCVS